MVESTAKPELTNQDFSKHELVTSGFIKEILGNIFIRATLTPEELVFSRIDMPNKTIEDLKAMPPTDLKTAMQDISLKPHPNVVCPEICHVPVFKQQRGAVCGYHMYYNAQMFAKAILAANRYEQLLSLCQCVTQTGSPKYFQKSMRETATLLVKNQHGENAT